MLASTAVPTLLAPTHIAALLAVVHAGAGEGVAAAVDVQVNKMTCHDDVNGVAHKWRVSSMSRAAMQELGAQTRAEACLGPRVHQRHWGPLQAMAARGRSGCIT